MKKQLKPAEKKGLETAGKDEEIIDLKNMVNKNHVSPEQNEDDILDLTDEVSLKEQKSLEAGIIELTETIPPLSRPTEDKDDLQDGSSDNVIHLADMTSVLLPDETDNIEELSQEDFVELSDEDPSDSNNEDLGMLSDELESAIADSLDDEEGTVEPLPDSNLIDIDDFGGSDHEDIEDEIIDFDLLSESEPDMTSSIDAIDVEELDDETTFEDLGSALSEELDDLSNSSDGNEMDDDFSETALALNRAMQADRNSVYPDDNEDELNEEIESIRNKLDNVFPEEDSQDPLSAFNTANSYDQEDEEDEFNTDKLILPPFDENESDAPTKSLDDTLFEAKATPIDSDIPPNKAVQTGPFDSNVNLYNAKTSQDQLTEDQFTEDKFKPFEAEVTVSNDEIESAVQHAIETKYGKKIEQMIIQAIEKTVAREIAKIKKAILDEPGSLDKS
jgi:hypothetical protein